jgi:hypothetical protein
MSQQIGFRATDTVIRDCRRANEENLARIDYSDVIALMEELGLLGVRRGVNTFAREGLLK